MKGFGLGRFNLEEALTVLDGLSVLNQHFNNRALGFSLDFIHDLHGFDNAGHGLFLDLGIYVGKGRAIGRSTAVKGANHGGFDIGKSRIIIDRTWGRRSSRYRSCRFVALICHRESDLLEWLCRILLIDDWLITQAAFDLYFKALFLDLEFGEF